jgi:arylsulfatase A-like enzyme
MRRPNILFVFADQHRAATTGCYGNREIRTPNIDALACDGALARTAISNAPLCGPYRACLMTGMYSYKSGMPTNFQPFNPPGPCIGDMFRNAGYRTGYVGKLHLWFPTGNRELDNRPEVNLEFVPPGKRCGFDDYWRGINEGHDFHDWHYYVQDDPIPVHSTRYQAEVHVDQALDFIREKESNQREWCLFLSWTPPHPPFNPPAGYAERYPHVTLPANVPAGKPRDYFQRTAARYYGLIESVDEQLGRLLKGLADCGAAENTIFVYTADHGEMLAAQGYMGHKRWPYDDSLRVPFVVRWPGHVKPGSTLNKPLSAIDIYPTLLELAGIPIPPGLDGKSAARALLTGDESNRDEFAYCCMHYCCVPWPGWRALRSQRYLYARTVDSPWLLYDLQTDPLEQNNLIAQPAFAALRAQFDVMLTQRMSSAGDSWTLRLDTGDAADYADATSPKVRENDMGYPWPGGPYDYKYV